MSPIRDDWPDDLDDPRPPRDERTAARSVLTVAGGVALVLLAAAGLAVAVLPGPGPTPPPPAGPWSPHDNGTRTVMSRDGFRQAVLGKTEAEVIKRFDQPAEVTADGPRARWHYRRATTHPSGARLDAEAVVTFEGGVATAVDIVEGPGDRAP